MRSSTVLHSDRPAPAWIVTGKQTNDLVLPRGLVLTTWSFWVCLRHACAAAIVSRYRRASWYRVCGAYKSLSLSLSLYLSISLSLYIYIYIHIYSSLSLSLYIYIYIDTPIYLSIYLSIYLYLCIHMCIYIYIYIYMGLHACVLSRVPRLGRAHVSPPWEIKCRAPCPLRDPIFCHLTVRFVVLCDMFCTRLPESRLFAIPSAPDFQICCYLQHFLHLTSRFVVKLWYW